MHSATLVGIDAWPVEVETELSQGLPNFSIIGLGDAAVQEARFRIQAALRSSELDLPHRRITINLAPAGLRKDGASLDLPMALSLLVAAEILDAQTLRRTVAIGELSLSGEIRAVRGVLPIAAMAKARGAERVIVPWPNGHEARALDKLDVIAAPDLARLVAHIRDGAPLPAPPSAPKPTSTPDLDLADVRGQPFARRALEIAAAGGHNLLFIGHPGAGKTMLARRLPTILPPLDADERIAVSKVWSAAGLIMNGQSMVTRRPFRAPHHSTSEAGLIGGGNPVRPGEVSLAHRGVLFLDEVPELPRRTLESLRQPLEDRFVTIARARHVVRLPAAFMLVAAANPCPCGWNGHGSGRCWCRADEIHRYLGRLSGPMLDRIDMVVETPSLTPDALMMREAGENSENVRRRVEAARNRSRLRNISSNSELSGKQLRVCARLNDAAERLLEKALSRLHLTARSMDRVLRVARTVADLDRSERIDSEHLAEALQYRPPARETRAVGIHPNDGAEVHARGSVSGRPTSTTTSRTSRPHRGPRC